MEGRFRHDQLKAEGGIAIITEKHGSVIILPTYDELGRFYYEGYKVFVVDKGFMIKYDTEAVFYGLTNNQTIINDAIRKYLTRE